MTVCGIILTNPAALFKKDAPGMKKAERLRVYAASGSPLFWERAGPVLHSGGKGTVPIPFPSCQAPTCSGGNGGVNPERAGAGVKSVRAQIVPMESPAVQPSRLATAMLRGARQSPI